MANAHPEVSPEARFSVIHCNCERQGPAERPSILTAKYIGYILDPMWSVVSRNPFSQDVTASASRSLLQERLRSTRPVCTAARDAVGGLLHDCASGPYKGGEISPPPHLGARPLQPEQIPWHCYSAGTGCTLCGSWDSCACAGVSDPSFSLVDASAYCHCECDMPHQQGKSAHEGGTWSNIWKDMIVARLASGTTLKL